MPMVGLGNLGVLLFHPMAQLMNFWCLDSQKHLGSIGWNILHLLMFATQKTLLQRTPQGFMKGIAAPRCI